MLNKSSIVLGINTAHDASACLLIDGALQTAIAEDPDSAGSQYIFGDWVHAGKTMGLVHYGKANELACLAGKAPNLKPYPMAGPVGLVHVLGPELQSSGEEKNLLEAGMSTNALLNDPLQNPVQNFPPACELNVAPQNLINYTLDNAMSLSVILARKDAYPWFYENYVQLFSIRVFRRLESGYHDMVEQSEIRGDEHEAIAVHFAVRSGKKWFHECLIKRFWGDDPDDIISFIVKLINLGCYLRLEVDEYYLPNKRSFERREWVHPNLIYGYDNDREVVLALGFDTKIFGKLTFTYDDLRKAYASARRISQDPSKNKALVSVIKMSEPLRRYPFSLKRFANELQHYLSSTIDSAKKFDLTVFLPASVDVDSILRWGFRIYEHVEAGLQQVLVGNNCISYVQMHALYEHKRFLLEAFRFIISEYQFAGKLVELADEFQEVVRAFHSMRWKFLRYEHSKDQQLIREIIDQLSVATAAERRLLEQIHAELLANCPS